MLKAMKQKSWVYGIFFVTKLYIIPVSGSRFNKEYQIKITSYKPNFSCSKRRNKKVGFMQINLSSGFLFLI